MDFTAMENMLYKPESQENCSYLEKHENCISKDDSTGELDDELLNSIFKEITELEQSFITPQEPRAKKVELKSNDQVQQIRQIIANALENRK